MWIPRSKACCQILLQQDKVSVAPCEQLQCTAEPLHHPIKKKKIKEAKKGYVSEPTRPIETFKISLSNALIVHPEHKQNPAPVYFLF